MSQSSEPIRIGIIGLGDHARQGHLQHLLAMPEECRITMLADIDQERSEQVAAGIEDVQVTQDWEEVATSDKVEAIMIMTPDRLHTAQLLAAVGASKHVFCEKPLATDAVELSEVAAGLYKAERDGLIVSSCHPRRFDPPYMRMRQYVQDPDVLRQDFGTDARLGRILEFDLSFEYHKPTKQGLHTSLLFDHLNHEVDTMHMLFGADGIMDAARHHDDDRAFLVTGHREDGIRFVFQGSRYLEEREYRESIWVRGSLGSVAIDCFNGVAVFDSATGRRTKSDDAYKTDYTARFVGTNRNFLRAVGRQAEPYVTSRELLINTRAAIDLPPGQDPAEPRA